MAKPCTPQPIAQRVQLFTHQSRNVSLSLGDIKGVFSFAKENTPFVPCSANGAALPCPSAKIKKHHNLRCDALWSGRRGSNSLPGIPRTALRRFAGALPHLGFNAPSAQVEAARSLRLTKNRTSKSDALFHYGAGDEARTRYLHLGKVALYQMSYARGTRCTIPDIFRFVKHRF